MRSFQKSVTPELCWHILAAINHSVYLWCGNHPVSRWHLHIIHCWPLTNERARLKGSEFATTWGHVLESRLQGLSPKACSEQHTGDSGPFGLQVTREMLMCM